MVYRRGARAERELVAILKEKGFFVSRFAGSKPIDLIAAKNGKVLLIEVKYLSKQIYIAENKVKEHILFSEHLNALPLIAIRLRGGGWKALVVREPRAIYIRAQDAPNLENIEPLIDNYLKNGL